ncbi:PspC domain-containing protein [Actinoalloteichus caeruleus]|uniref:PspC domain-containing protein n=1 Tax=Actinoalloteichus cyanogriseus TaxID=2893586 RepID=UPI00068CEFE7|nr:PspC domain-containing protein [Actinoalloteichus caeruleus]
MNDSERGPGGHPGGPSAGDGARGAAQFTHAFGGSSGARPPRRGDQGVEETLREMWRTRPARPVDNRKIAGVASGIARRYQIDPILARVGFVVLATIGGAGLILYLLGWLMLAQEGDESAPAEALVGRGSTSTSPGMPIALGALIVISVIIMLNNSTLTLFTGLVLGGGALFLLHRQRPLDERQPATTLGVAATDPGWRSWSATSASPAGAATADTSTPATPAETTAVYEPGAPSTSGPDPVPGSGAAHDGPPEWDPLGVAPFAWDLPDPGTGLVDREEEPPAEPTRRSKVTPITLAVALVVLAIALLDGTRVGLGWLEIPALVLGVLGIGMIIGAFVRGGRGLFWVAGPLAAITLLLSAVAPPTGWQGIGSHVWTVSDVSQLRDEYQVSAGQLHLDLSELTIPEGETASARVEVGVVGKSLVVLPPDLPVDVTCSVNLGDNSCLGTESSGSDLVERVDSVGQADELESGVLELEVHVGMGAVEVVR